MTTDNSLEIITSALAPSSFRHRIAVQPRWSDFDMLRHLNNAKYFDYFDLGKTTYFHTVISHDTEISSFNAVIANVNATFLAPVKYGEEIDVLTAVVAVSTHSFYIEQQIVNHTTGELKCRNVTAMVSFSAKDGQAIPLNPRWVEQIMNYEHNQVKRIENSANN